MDHDFAIQLEQQVQVQLNARMQEAMERMNLNEAEIGRAMNPPNEIGNSEMSDMEESKEESSMMSSSQPRYAKRNCRKIQE